MRRVAVMAGLAGLVLMVGGVAAHGPARLMDPAGLCDSGISHLIECRAGRSTTTTSRDGGGDGHSRALLHVDATAWAVVQCPETALLRRLFCDAHGLREGPDESVTGFPLPRPWIGKAAKTSRFIESLHVETPLAAATVLGFYRTTLARRGWTELADPELAPDLMELRFASPDGPVMLRIVPHQGGAIVDLARRRAGARPQPPSPGEARLLLGRVGEGAAVLEIDGRRVSVAGDAGPGLRLDPATGRASPGTPALDLPAGRVEVVQDGAARSTRSLDVAAGETWGVLAGPGPAPLVVRLD
jgi:hypothetical protein